MTAARLIGTSPPRVDAAAKSRGEHLFPSDNVLANMLWVQVVRSAKPHARILAIETGGAIAIEGVA
jgi:CO/xanthine dehydrogenase Mo-binding subunit